MAPLPDAPDVFPTSLSLPVSIFKLPKLPLEFFRGLLSPSADSSVPPAAAT